MTYHATEPAARQELGKTRDIKVQRGDYKHVGLMYHIRPSRTWGWRR